ncbi:hypothetical protein [Streptomyces sp. NRRL B-3648]|uniref:hypothetical protein n=1 Tax=Streptomyces sp. NRRL B-3648 TaxID=1519493 RepID=UPI0006ADC0FB|nr:hypothetical protein [Streptomyces sp. NRRL B-3648]
MGERHGGDGLPGARRAHPDGTVAAPEPPGTSPGRTELEARFGAALRARDAGPEAERNAVAAFRAAREAGAHDARTRARDDWRPGRPRRARRSLRTTLSLALASLTLGGAAVAAIGSARSGPEDGARHAPRSAHPSPGARSAPAAHATAAGTTARPEDTGTAVPSGRPAHPKTAGDTPAHCRAYAQAGERGGALEATAWQRLVAAAGGRDGVAAYCAARTARTRGGTTGTTARPGHSGATGEGNGNARGKGVGRGEPAGDPLVRGTSRLLDHLSDSLLRESPTLGSVPDLGPS